MKLATYKNGSRDGALLVVSRDLRRCRAVPSIAPNLQSALDNWAALAPRLEQVYAALNAGAAARLEREHATPDAGAGGQLEQEHAAPDTGADGQLEQVCAALDVGADGGAVMPFDERLCHAPLPRAYQWADGSAYLNHVELVRKARQAQLPASFHTDPLLYQGGSDSFIGPHDPIRAGKQEWGIDLEAEVAVITGDVAMGADEARGAQAICLIMLVNDVSLRNLIPGELAKGFGFFQSKPATAFSPVAVTPDELAPHWRGAKLHLPLMVSVNGRLFGRPNAGRDMSFNFAQLVAHAALTRDLAAGSIIGSGTVSNKQGGLHGSSIQNGGVGYACLAEVRMYEIIEQGAPATGFLRFGDRVRIEMLDPDGASIFGAIDQTVEPAAAIEPRAPTVAAAR